MNILDSDYDMDFDLPDDIPRYVYNPPPPSENQNQLYGIDSSRLANYEEVKNFIEELTCPICQHIVSNPVSCMMCESYFCKCCAHKWSEKANMKYDCPCCRGLGTSNLYNNINNHYIDVFYLEKIPKITKTLLSKFFIYCSNQSKGCEDLITYDNLNHHEENCDYSTIQCKNKGCNQKFLKKEQQKHNEVCAYFLKECPNCNIYIKQKNYNQHLEECEYRLLDCKYCKQPKFAFELKQHEKICDHQEVKCNRCRKKFLKKYEAQHTQAVCYRDLYIESLESQQNLRKQIQELKSENKQIVKNLLYISKQLLKHKQQNTNPLNNNNILGNIIQDDESQQNNEDQYPEDFESYTEDINPINDSINQDHKIDDEIFKDPYSLQVSQNQQQTDIQTEFQSLITIMENIAQNQTSLVKQQQQPLINSPKSLKEDLIKLPLNNQQSSSSSKKPRIQAIETVKLQNQYGDEELVIQDIDNISIKTPPTITEQIHFFNQLNNNSKLLDLNFIEELQIKESTQEQQKLSDQKEAQQKLQENYFEDLTTTQLNFKVYTEEDEDDDGDEEKEEEQEQEEIEAQNDYNDSNNSKEEVYVADFESMREYQEEQEELKEQENLNLNNESIKQQYQPQKKKQEIFEALLKQEEQEHQQFLQQQQQKQRQQQQQPLEEEQEEQDNDIVISLLNSDNQANQNKINSNNNKEQQCKSFLDNIVNTLYDNFLFDPVNQNIITKNQKPKKEEYQLQQIENLEQSQQQQEEISHETNYQPQNNKFGNQVQEKQGQQQVQNEEEENENIQNLINFYSLNQPKHYQCFDTNIESFSNPSFINPIALDQKYQKQDYQEQEEVIFESFLLNNQALENQIRKQSQELQLELKNQHQQYLKNKPCTQNLSENEDEENSYFPIWNKEKRNPPKNK